MAPKRPQGESSAHQRLKSIMSGAFAGAPTPLKDVPTRSGEPRRTKAPAKSAAPSSSGGKSGKSRKKSRAQ